MGVCVGLFVVGLFVVGFVVGLESLMCMQIAINKKPNAWKNISGTSK